jgi:hypothetical protein
VRGETSRPASVTEGFDRESFNSAEQRMTGIPLKPRPIRFKADQNGKIQRAFLYPDKNYSAWAGVIPPGRLMTQKRRPPDREAGVRRDRLNYPLELCLDGGFTALVSADADYIFDREDEDLAVADLAGFGGGCDRGDCLGREVVGDDDLKFGLGQEINRVFGSTIDLGVAFLAAEAFHFSDGHAFDADGGKGFFDLFQFEGLDDGDDEFHED